VGGFDAADLLGLVEVLKQRFQALLLDRACHWVLSAKEPAWVVTFSVNAMQASCSGPSVA